MGVDRLWGCREWDSSEGRVRAIRNVADLLRFLRFYGLRRSEGPIRL